MKKTGTFMTVHNDSETEAGVAQEGLLKCFQARNITLVRTYYSERKGLRFCVWLSPDEEEIKDAFGELGIGYDSLTPVEEIYPDPCGQNWEEHLKQEAVYFEHFISKFGVKNHGEKHIIF